MSCLSPGSSACCSWLFATRIAAPGCSEVAGRPHSTQRSTVSNTTFHHHAPRYRLDLSDGTSGPREKGAIDSTLACSSVRHLVCASLKAKRAKHQLRFGTSSCVNNSNVQSPIAPLYCSVDVSGLCLQFLRLFFRVLLLAIGLTTQTMLMPVRLSMGLYPPCLRRNGATLTAPCRACSTRKGERASARALVPAPMLMPVQTSMGCARHACE